MHKNPQATYKTVQEILSHKQTGIHVLLCGNVCTLPEVFRILNENSAGDWMHRTSHETFNIFRRSIARLIISLISLSTGGSKFGREIMLINT